MTWSGGNPSGRLCKTRQARRAVMLSFGIFVAVQYWISRSAESSTSTIGDPVFAEKFKLLKQHTAFFVESSTQPRMMAIGSSRTLLSLDARLIEEKTQYKSFNYGCSGSGPITSALYLRRLLELGVRFDLLFIELHGAMLTNHNQPYESRWLHPYRIKASEFNLLKNLGWNAGQSNSVETWNWLRSAHDYRFSILDCYAPQLSACPFGLSLGERVDTHGHVKGIQLPETEHQRATLRELTTYLPALQGYRPGGAATLAIEDMIDQCKSHHIKPILLMSTESREFRSWYGAYGYQQLIQWAKGVSIRTQVRLIDASEWIDDCDLIDGHHPNSRGSRTFTLKLIEELK